MSNQTRRQNLGLGKTAAGGSGGSFATHSRDGATPPASADGGVLSTTWTCDDCADTITVPATELSEIGTPVCVTCDEDMQSIGDIPELYIINHAGGTVETVASFVRIGDELQANGMNGTVTGSITNPDGSITLSIGGGAGVTLHPAARVEIEDPFADIRRSEWDENTCPVTDDGSLTWTGREIGLDHLNVTDAGVAGSAEDGSVYAYATVYENPVAAGALTREQFDRGDLYLRDALHDEYGIEIHHAEDDVLHMEFTADLRGEHTVSDLMVSDVLESKTELARWHNESDAGTYGSPYFYSGIRKNIDAGFFPGAGNDSTFDHQIRQDAREAASFAVHGRSRDRFPQLSMLADRGYCLDAHAAHAEVLDAAKDLGEIRETSKLRDLLDGEIREQDERNA